ncbi:MAG: hypothetical protein GY775_08315 [Candidatus Scalindua sp.]|nr:hypothetical protein [Candidatus Scalindua sp.]
MFNFIRGWLINKLKPPFHMVDTTPLTQKEKEYLYSEEHKEFLNILFRALNNRRNENIALLVGGRYGSDEERGVIQGSVRAIQDIIEQTSKPKQLKSNHQPVSFEDVISSIENQISGSK